MNRRNLLEMTLILALAIVPASAFAQAAAESALLNAGSSTATAKAGSALNSALNQASKQLAGRVQRQVLQQAPGKGSPVGGGPVSISPVKNSAVRPGTAPAQGAMIASIQGAVTSCVPANQKPSVPGSNAGTGSAPTNCGSQDSPTPVPSKYKSVISLSFPKR